jgi:hypothetical protein
LDKASSFISSRSSGLFSLAWHKKQSQSRLVLPAHQAGRAAHRRARRMGVGTPDPEAFLPSRCKRVPDKSKLVELLLPKFGQAFFVSAANYISYPLTKGEAIFFVELRNATMTFALHVHCQIAKAFLPSRFERVPNKSKLIELLLSDSSRRLTSLARRLATGSPLR